MRTAEAVQGPETARQTPAVEVPQEQGAEAPQEQRAVAGAAAGAERGLQVSSLEVEVAVAATATRYAV